MSTRKKLGEITKEVLDVTIETEDLFPYVESDKPSTDPDVMGIAVTKKENFLVYSTDARGKMYHTSVHFTRGAAYAMLLKRMRARVASVAEA